MKLSRALAEELELARLRHLHAGSLDVAQEILDLLTMGDDPFETTYDDGYREALADAKRAIEDLGA